MQFAVLYHKKLIDKIIFPRDNNWDNYDRIKSNLADFPALGVNLKNIYITDRFNNDINPLNFFKPYISAKYLPYLEYHIADHCNLNCKACGHHSGLVTSLVFPNFRKFTKDFEQLHKFIDDIETIRIMGGEPLLNPEVNEYVKLTRRLYPLAQINVVTNAILLPKMPDEFFKTLRENNARIDISVYPPMESKLPAILRLLKEKRIAVRVLHNESVKYFKLLLSMKERNQALKSFFDCKGTRCTALYDGKVAVCIGTFTVKYFNDYFGKNLPQYEAVDLYEEGLTTEKLMTFLLKPIELCRHCTKNKFLIKWGTVTHPSPITDWTNDHLR